MLDDGVRNFKFTTYCSVELNLYCYALEAKNEQLGVGIIKTDLANITELCSFGR